MRSPLTDLAAAGVAVWLDDLSRDRIDSGNLAAPVARGVVGVTTDPSIFAAALAHRTSYAGRLAALAGVDPADAVVEITMADVRDAADVLRPVHDATGGVDGRVSLDVDPRLCRDADATLAQAERLWAGVDRPNLVVKIRATVEGLPAITAALARGISVNVTLIFSVERCRAVLDAFTAGIEQALATGHDVAAIGSVASVFVSRVDTAIDPPGSTRSAPLRPRRCAAGRRSRTPASPTRSSGAGATARAGGCSPPRVRARSARSGPRPA